MKILTSLVALGALATGVTGASIAYVTAAPGPTTSSSSTAAPATTDSSTEPPQVTAVPEPGVRLRMRYRSCRVGAHLEGRRCVRRVVRTVVVPAPAPAAPPAGSMTATSAFTTGGQRQTEGGEDHSHEVEPGDDRGEDGGEDHEQGEDRDHGPEQPEHDD